MLAGATNVNTLNNIAVVELNTTALNLCIYFVINYTKPMEQLMKKSGYI